MSDNRLLPFGTFYFEGKELVMMIMAPNEKEKGYIYCELPDKIYGFMLCKITYPDLEIIEREGFSDEQMSRIISICRNNLKFTDLILQQGEQYYA